MADELKSFEQVEAMRAEQARLTRELAALRQQRALTAIEETVRPAPQRNAANVEDAPVVTTAELGRVVGLSRRTIRRYHARGFLPAPRKGAAASGRGRILLWPFTAIHRAVAIKTLYEAGLPVDAIRRHLTLQTQPEAPQREVEQAIALFTISRYALKGTNATAVPAERFRALITEQLAIMCERVRAQVAAITLEALLPVVFAQYLRGEHPVLVAWHREVRIWPDYLLSVCVPGLPGTVVTLGLWPILRQIFDEWQRPPFAPPPSVRTARKVTIRHGDAVLEREFDLVGGQPQIQSVVPLPHAS
jgi:DNA-binding transcriptional MerR regulator